MFLVKIIIITTVQDIFLRSAKWGSLGSAVKGSLGSAKCDGSLKSAHYQALGSAKDVSLQSLFVEVLYLME